MSFVSFAFFGSLLIVGTLFYMIPFRWRSAFLLIASYGFYAVGNPFNLLLLLATSGAVYWLGLKLARAETDRLRALILGLGISALVGVIVEYKLEGVLNGIYLPLGLSYYSFKLMSYLSEVYWDEGQVEKDPLLVFLYPAFFPQIISGPIQRPNDFFIQIRRSLRAKANYTKIEEGFRLILGGLMMKMLIGDRLGAFIDIVDKSPTDYRWSVLSTTIICYTLRLYADFSGYTNIAIGIGKIFGIDSPPNFNAPFAAPNIQEMWRRWHMSLTTWVSDYLFMPLQMASRGLGRAGLVLSLFASMVVIGLWHGLTVNFAVFGILHAVFVVATVLSAKVRDRLFAFLKAPWFVRSTLGIILTFVLMTFSQIFWHTPTWQGAILRLRLLFGAIPAGGLGLNDIRTDAVEPLLPCMAIALYSGLGAPGVRRALSPFERFVPNWVEYGVCLLLISCLKIEAGTSFVYGQF